MAVELTRGSVLREFRRLCDVVDEAEAAGLLDMDDAIAMRDRYRERADVILDHFKRETGAVVAAPNERRTG